MGNGFTETGAHGKAAYLAARVPNQASLAPEVPTDFQQFVQASTGERLPIFGASLFETTRASFDTVLDGPAPSETIIGPGDELRIRVWGQVNFSANLIVSRQGNIYLPKVGSVEVAGLPFASVSTHLTNVMNGIYHNYEMSVDLGAIHSIQIYMTGLAHRPGVYTVSGLSTLVNAVFQSGGPKADGSMRHVLLKRDGKVAADYDLYKLVVSGDKSGDVQLQPGDVLDIPPTGPQIAILGSVRQPAIYELRGNESIGEVIKAAGGKTTIASNARISIERINDHSSRTVLRIAQDESGLSTVLADGDIVRIEPIVSNFKQAVTLRGAVANPGRFTWQQGMRISDVIPDMDAVVKRNYWWYRTRLDIASPETLPAVSSDVAITTPEAQTNWNYAVIERLAPATMKTSLIPFNLGALVFEHDASQDLELKPGDVITIFSQADIHIPLKEQTKYIRLEGEFVHPGVYSAGPGDTLRTIVDRAGGFTPEAYLYGAVFTRLSTKNLEQKEINEAADRLEHQFVRNSLATGTSAGPTPQTSPDVLAVNRELIAKLRSVRASGRIVLNPKQVPGSAYQLPDMRLEDGDSLEVPFTPATVQVIGAVYNSNAFLYSPGLDAGRCLHMAGGPNRDADRRRVYVLRANGSVATSGSDPWIFAHGFDHVVLHPGDSVVVPEKYAKPSVMSQVAGWAQFVSGSAITAASINSLR